MMQLIAPAGMAPAGCILARFFKKFLLHWDVTKVLLEPQCLAVKNCYYFLQKENGNTFTL